jgi:hypothetical protein
MSFARATSRERSSRCPGLLHLQEERIARIAAEEQDDPVPRADAPDPDDGERRDF